ncbi:MAG TPA: glycosyltransferase family 4 protein [Stenomitos sp.]
MKITLIASDETSAPLYRVRMLARMLARRFEVEVLGFHFKPDEIDPLAPRDFPYRGFAAHPWPGFYRDAQQLARAATGDLLYAMKPRPTSYGVCLALRAATGKPVVVDVDDWEPYMIHPYSKFALKNAAYALPRLKEPNNYLATRLMDLVIRRADGVTTVSSHFQQRYGGLLAPQYVDTERFDPHRYAREALRARYELDDLMVAVFAGIAQPNKGVGEILAAFRRLGDRRDWRLVIVGPKTPYAQELAAQDDRVLLLGTQPPKEAPAFLSMADLVVLPQRREPASQGQMPMKLYEAMAMALPVVSTAVSDIPRLLTGCGRVVVPGDPGALAAAIGELLDHPAFARELGARARRRILDAYSYDRGSQEVGDYFERLMTRKLAPELGGRPC